MKSLEFLSALGCLGGIWGWEVGSFGLLFPGIHLKMTTWLYFGLGSRALHMDQL